MICIAYYATPGEGRGHSAVCASRHFNSFVGSATGSIPCRSIIKNQLYSTSKSRIPFTQYSPISKTQSPLGKNSFFLCFYNQLASSCPRAQPSNRQMVPTLKRLHRRPCLHLEQLQVLS